MSERIYRKTITFSFSIPITSLEKNKSLFSSVNVGEITVYGKGKVLKEPATDSPYAFQTEEERGWVEINLTGVFFKDVDILPVFQNMKECRDVRRALLEASANNCLTIYFENHK